MSAFYRTVARFYDAENADKTDDLALYRKLASARRGDILDVGCGTGRVLIHLAQAGHRVYGIDSSGPMLERLEGKLGLLPDLQSRITVVHADILEHEFRRRFGLILATYNVLMHFREQEEQIALLSRLRAWLEDDGLLVIDLPSAGPAFASEDSDSLTMERRFLDAESGRMVMLQSLSTLDRAKQTLYVDWVYDVIDGEGLVTRLVAPHLLRYYFLPELTLLLERCGFKVDAAYGDTELGPYTAESERMIVFASPA